MNGGEGGQQSITLGAADTETEKLGRITHRAIEGPRLVRYDWIILIPRRPLSCD